MTAASVAEVATVVVAVWILAFLACAGALLAAYVVETRRDAALADWRARYAASSAETSAARSARPHGGVSDVLPLNTTRAEETAHG